MFPSLLTLVLSLSAAQSLEDAVTLNNRGAGFQQNGASGAAELCYLRALAGAQQEGAPAETLARIHGNLAALYKSQRRFQLAVRHYRASLSQRREAKPRARALTLNSLAEAMREAGDENSVHRFREALRLLESDAASTALDRAVVGQNLAVTLAESGRFSEALQLLREALSIKKQLFAEGHEQVVITERNLIDVERSLRASRLKRGAPRDTVDVLELVRP